MIVYIHSILTYRDGNQLIAWAHAHTHTMTDMTGTHIDHEWNDSEKIFGRAMKPSPRMQVESGSAEKNVVRVSWMWNCEGRRGPGWAEATSGHSQLLGNFDCGVGELHYKRPPSVLNSMAAQKRWALQFLPQQHSPLTPPQDWHGLVGRSCWSHFLKMQLLCWNALCLHTFADILSVRGWNADKHLHIRLQRVRSNSLFIFFILSQLLYLCYLYSRHHQFGVSFTSEMWKKGRVVMPQTLLREWVLFCHHSDTKLPPYLQPTLLTVSLQSYLLPVSLMETHWPLISISGSLKSFLNVRFSIFCFLLDSQSSETSSLEVAFSNGLLCVLCCAFFCPSLVVAHGAGLPGNI